MKRIDTADLFSEIRSCTLCAPEIEPRPIIRGTSTARLLIIGQAPGSKVHASGIPWDDASGKRLRNWLSCSIETFYNEDKIAIVPMGFCYPGTGKSGDLAPRKECAATWHASVLRALPNVEHTLLIGRYAQNYYLPNSNKTLSELVQASSSDNSQLTPLPHPSPRNNIWLKKNPWFEQEVVPDLQRRLKRFW